MKMIDLIFKRMSTIIVSREDNVLNICCYWDDSIRGVCRAHYFIQASQYKSSHTNTNFSIKNALTCNRGFNSNEQTNYNINHQFY
jgi:hypothetical protein